jgi:prepilin-type N-terminal cleavage/methylation domain-containing protein
LICNQVCSNILIKKSKTKGETMKKSGFTMIELIFVIVIIGILAAVAVPKLAATRTDAKVAAISQEASGLISEVPAYVVSQGKVSDLSAMSQIAKTVVQQNKAYEYNKTTSGTNGKDITSSSNYARISNSIDTILLGTQNDSGTLVTCLAFDVNSTTLVVKDANSSDAGAICAGVQARIKEGNYTIAGSHVKF